MKKQKHILPMLILLFLGIQMTSWGQKAPMKWGKISKEDLAMTVYEPDSSANAVVLADYGELKFNVSSGDLRYILERHRRIKIINRSGFEEADVTLPYYSHKNYERISDIKAQVFLPNGDRIKLSKDNIFKEEINEYNSRIKLSFPQLVEGCIIEFEYRKSSENISTLEEWYFQENIPIRWSEFRVEIPEWYDYVFLTQGRALDLKETEKGTTMMRPPIGSAIGSVPVLVQRHRMVMKNVEALKSEAYITTMADYLARIKFQLSKIQYPNTIAQSYLTSWSKVAKDLNKADYFGKQFNKKSKYVKIWNQLEPLLTKANTPEEKVGIAYDFLNQQMTWNENYGRYVDTDLNDCYEKKQADSGELNLMMIAMMREAGIEAHPIMVSTRNHGKMLSLYPIMDQFNHVMALVNTGNKQILVDLGNPLRPLNFPRVSSLNYVGWLVNPEQPQWIELSPPKSQRAMMGELTLSEDGVLSGSIKQNYTGYDAVSSRYAIASNKEEENLFQKRWSEKYPDLEATAFEAKGLENINSSLTTSYEIKLSGAGQSNGDYLYLSPVLFPEFEENPFKVEKRSYPVDIPYYQSIHYIMNIELPEGYVVEELPEPINLALPNNGGSLTYTAKLLNNKIQIISRFAINQLRFDPEEYIGLKAFFDYLIEKEEEQIVLKKRT